MSRTVDRRDLLRGGLALGGAAAVGMAAAGDARAATTLNYDVACLIDTFTFTPAPGSRLPDDMRGATFVVEGLIYEGGTVHEGSRDFDPRATPAIGTWICRGWFINVSSRPDPDIISTQEYMFPALEQATFPADQLVSSGLEGAADPSKPAVRSVVGGTGRFAGARGSVVQRGIGTNTTRLGPGGLLDAGPNFRFSFALLPESRSRHARRSD